MRMISIPASIVVNVPDDFDIEDEDALFDAVVDQHGKYVEVDARHLGFDQAVNLG